MRVAGLFAGIGGIELGLGDAFEDALLCEIDPNAQAVLRARFPDVPLWDDIATLDALPDEVDVVTAGFPCQDLSQAGRTAGIRGARSGLVTHLFGLIRRAKRPPTWLIIENVRNMLPLDRGRAMEYLVSELERLGFAWAYRVIDTRAFGLPQRRQRVLLLASRTEDPRAVLLADDAGEPSPARYRDNAFGFYWTEGLRGLGWAEDAVPTLKGGSALGIPSPPAVWLPWETEGRRFVTPSIVDAERLQGFPAGWTDPGHTERRAEGARWKMVGNAVSVPVAQWVGDRLLHPGQYEDGENMLLGTGERWPSAAWGSPGRGRRAADISMWPRHDRYVHLLDVLDHSRAHVLSAKAASGFLSRLERSNLRAPEEFRRDLKVHIEFMLGP
jgi:DNA (cytosine-5)-methyltransferase 1